jgi:tetratricopeptide (TPR) repeat protein
MAVREAAMFARVLAFAAFAALIAANAQAQTDDSRLCLSTSMTAPAADRIAGCTRYIAVAKGGLLVQAYTERGVFKRMSGDYAGAIADFSAALVADEKAKPLYDEIDRQLAPGMRAYALRGRGLTKEAMKNQSGALADYDLALKNEPDSLLVLLSRASLLAKLGRKEDAAADYRKALANDLIDLDDAFKAQAEAGLKAASAAP